MFTLKKVKFTEITRDASNPRDLNSASREVLKLSLSKLGLLSPLYIQSNGMLLSGHQRSRLVEEIWGKNWIPCCYVRKLTSNYKNACNWLYNKELQEQTQNIRFDYEKDQLKMVEMLNSMESVKDPYEKLLSLETIDVGDIIANDAPEDLYNASIALWRITSSVIPILINSKNEIVNGRARFQVYKKMFKKVPCVRVVDLVSEVFKIATATYDINKHKDNLRVQATRHFITSSQGDLSPFSRIITGQKIFDSGISARANFLKRNYKNILDFGSGNGKQSVEMRSKGLDWTLFEPFATKGKAGSFNLRETYESIEKFLLDYKQKGGYDLVGAHAVLNSIPFEEDARKVCLLLAYLAKDGKDLSLTSRTTFQEHQRGTNNKLTDRKVISSGVKTKVQTCHNLKDIEDYVGVKSSTHFIDATYIVVRFKFPRREFDRDELIDAVRFEFGLDYMGRKFKNLTKLAEEVFLKNF